VSRACRSQIVKIVFAVEVVRIFVCVDRAFDLDHRVV